MMDESNTYSGCDADVVPNNPRMRTSGVIPVIVDDQRTAVSEAALQGYCVGYMEAMGAWLWKCVGTELSDEYCARFDACAEALKAALGVEIGEKHEV